MTTSTEHGAEAPGFSSTPWDVANPLVLVDCGEEPFNWVQVQHLDYPIEYTLVAPPSTFRGYCEIAYDYLCKVKNKLGIDLELLDGLRPNAPTSWAFRLGWQGIDYDPWLAASDPRQSYALNRFDPADPPPDGNAQAFVDNSLVLLACLSIGNSSGLFGGQGLRILAKVSFSPDGPVKVSITGVTATVRKLATSAALLLRGSFITVDWMRKFSRLAMHGLPANNSIVDGGLTILPPSTSEPQALPQIEYRVTTAMPASDAPESLQMDRTSHRLVTRIEFHADKDPTYTVRLQPQIAFATPQALVLKRDPLTKLGASSYWQVRPSLPNSELNPHRQNVSWGSLPPSTPGQIDLNDGEVLVRNVRLVDPPLTEGVPKRVPECSIANVRSNEFTAVSAFYHGQSLFRRMRQFGLLPSSLLRFVSLPLDIHYRAGILPGYGDGRTVNAQVRWAISTPASIATGAAPAPPAPAPAGTIPTAPATPIPVLAVRRLELRFALGDLSMCGGRLPANLPSAFERRPLGIAIDARWCWHEFGHVLIAGATGDLELPFAHSAGDALAAIENDPDSKLACAANGAADNLGAWRHATFPWVHIPRRHDRDVQRGWSWTETVSGIAPPHGYRSEQLMSTSLFRLYRALGGDCMRLNHSGLMVPARPERQKAADYVGYLIMRTIASLGPASVSPCTSVRMFVHTMRSVDCFTGGVPGPGNYVGGTANKVIQWAFERQGLYGVPIPGSPIIGAEGRPDTATQVDLHIDDQRDQRDGPYSPVNLLGAAWHAAHGAIAVQRANPQSFTQQIVNVTVRNRGRSPAPSTTVQVWCTPLPESGQIPDYPGASWVLVGSVNGSMPGHDGSVPGSLLFPSIIWTPSVAGIYVVLAATSSPLDRSNIDPASVYPCANLPGPTNQLVAFDNNLGLTIVST